MRPLGSTYNESMRSEQHVCIFYARRTSKWITDTYFKKGLFLLVWQMKHWSSCLSFFWLLFSISLLWKVILLGFLAHVQVWWTCMYIQCIWLCGGVLKQSLTRNCMNKVYHAFEGHTYSKRKFCLRWKVFITVITISV